jgi:hypothetical protein
MKHMFSLKRCGKVKFLLDHLGDQFGRPNRQGIGKQTVQQIEFFFLSSRVCLDGFHNDLYSSHNATFLRTHGQADHERETSRRDERDILLCGFRPVLGLCEPVAGLTAKWARTWWGSGFTSAFW